MKVPPARLPLAVLVTALLGLAPSSAYAYVGPGSGISAIGAALALVGGIFLAIVGFVWYPVKRLLRSMRRAPTEGAMTDPGTR